MTRTPIWVYLAVAALLICGIILPEMLSLGRVGYSSAGNYLSELGEIGADTAAITNRVAFPVVAISSAVLLLFAALRCFDRRSGRIGAVLLMIGLSSGYLIAVLFPCDPGCPAIGSSRQAVHNLAGLVQYPLGALGLIVMGLAKRGQDQIMSRLLTLAGVAMAVGFLMMLVPDMASWRGAWQRLGDYSAFIALSALCLRRGGEMSRP